MNYFKTSTNKANSSWSPVKPKITSRFESSGPEYSRPRAPQNHVPQPNVSFNLGALVMFRQSYNYSEAAGNPQSTPVYRITNVSGDLYKLRQAGAGGYLDGWYAGHELRLASGQEPEAENVETERSSKGKNEWDAKTLVSDDERWSRDDETLYGRD